MKKRTYGTGSLREKRPGKWELRYQVPGESQPRSETVDAVNRKDADRELRERLKAIEEKRLGPKVSMGDLFDLYLRDQRIMQRKQASIVKQKIEKHLRPRFGSVDVYALDPLEIDRYKEERLKQSAQISTINHELSILQRTINLAREKRVANVILAIEKIPGENVRQGFLEEHVYRAIREKLPSHQIALFTVAYYTGIRAGELLDLKWQYINFFGEIPLIKIPGEVTKNGKPRTIPLYHPEMVESLKLAYQSRSPSCPWMFQFRGTRLRDYRQGWDDACTAAGYPDILFHDTRRTAVRNMERAGVRRTDAMQISGHRTESVYHRYDIASEQGAFEAAEKLRKFHAERQAKKILGNFWDETQPEGISNEPGIDSKSLN